MISCYRDCISEIVVKGTRALLDPPFNEGGAFSLLAEKCKGTDMDEL